MTRSRQLHRATPASVPRAQSPVPRSRRAGARRGPVLVLLLLVALAPSSALASAEQEAARQIGFARTELAQGKPDRALRSAESALRLCPDCLDAVIVKALAYEALGNPRLAEGLLLAYMEMVPEGAASEEATENLARIQGRLLQRRSAAPRTSGATVPVPAPDLGGDAVAGLDLEPYRQRVRDALEQGQCRVASSAADELTLAAPGEVEGWRLAGDAARCSGNARGAVLAYRRYEARGGSERSVLEVLRGLAGSLGSVRVVLDLAPGSPVPAVSLHSEQEDFEPVAVSDKDLAFQDLPVGVPLRLSASGRGLRPESRAVDALGPADEVRIEVAPAWVGLGRVRVAALEADLCRTTLVTAAEELAVEPGQEVTLTAGEALARVENDSGVLEAPIQVVRDSAVEFDPRNHLPASLTVVGLPAGSEVRVFLEGAGGEAVDRTDVLPPADGAIDGETGVRLAPPHKLSSLRGGAGGIFVSHPVLGDAPGSLVVETGRVNAWTFDWESLPGVPGVRERYLEWRAADARVRQARTRAGVLAVSSAILAGASAAMLLGSGAQDGVMARTKADGIAAGAGGLDEDALDSAWEANRSAERARAGLLTAGSVGVGLAGAGLVVTVVAGGSARRAAAEVGEWDPAALPATGPEPVTENSPHADGEER